MREPAIDYLERTAAVWDASGRNSERLLRGLDLVALHCWIPATEGKRVEVSQTLRAFAAASMEAQGAGWYDAILSERGSCSRCGERYRIENLAICTSCEALTCSACLSNRPRAQTGQRLCACGGETAG